MHTWLRAGLVGILSAGLAPSAAGAQQGSVLGVGASVAWVSSSDPFVHGVPRLGPLVRFGESREGWGTRIGLNWYEVNLDASIDDDALEFGSLRVRPFMAGYGYTRIFGPVAGSANVLLGYAFTSFSLEAAFANAYRQARGVDRVTVDVSNAFVFKPEISAWIDVSRTVGLNFSLGYLIARPGVTLDSAVGPDRHDIRGDVFMVKIGAVYAVF
jgi:hypothetical protein